MSVDLSPRSHIDTPAWQSFEMRMRVRAAEHRAAKRKRRALYAAAALFSATLGAGTVVALLEVTNRMTASAVAWPDVPVAPAMPLPNVPAPLPLPSNWDLVIEREPALEQEPVVEVAAAPIPPPAVSVPPAQPPVRPTTTEARAAPRYEWPPRREAPPPETAASPPRTETNPPVAIDPVRIAEPPPTAAAVGSPPPATTTPAAAVGSPPPATTTPAAAVGSPPPTTTSPPVSTAVPRVDPRESVRGVLERYRAAYERLDASAARAVWPGVDAGALARAFNALASQQVSFDNCAITVAGSSADANCSGRARVVPKIGGGSETTRRTWQFRLRQTGNDWVIERATVRN